MSISSRQEKILSVLSERVFITVNELASLTFTSPSSIRRDLTHMQNNGLVKRTHGGVSLPEPLSGVASFYDRTQKSIKEKRIISQKASSLLEDGQNVMLDSSSTAAFLLPFIAKKNNVHLFTNNLSTAVNAIESGIKTTCLGGNSANGSIALSGTLTYKALSSITVDVLFFSSQGLDRFGNISDSTEEENYVRQLMIKSAKKSIFLCDSKKFNTSFIHKLCNINEIDIAVFDAEFGELTASCRLI